MHEMLDVHVNLTLGSTGDVALPASNFTFEWDAGPPVPVAILHPPVVHSSPALVDSACDSGATSSSGIGPGGARNSSMSLQLVMPAAVPAHSVPGQAVSGPQKLACTQTQWLQRLVGLHPAVRALLTCSTCGHCGHMKEDAKQVLGIGILYGCPYEPCCLCHMVGHAA